MKTHFCSKPFIILKHHSPPIFPSFHFPVPLWHISVLPAGFFPFSTQVSAWYPSLWYQSSSPLDRHTNTLCLRPPAGWDRAGTGLGPEFRRGQKHNPSGADSHSWTLKYNALISRSACSYKSNGFNANHACQRSTKRLQFSPPIPTFSPFEASTLLLCRCPPGARAGLMECPQPRCTLARCNFAFAGLRSGATAETLHQKANSKKTNTITRPLKCSW